VCPFEIWTANVQGVQDGNHPWPGLVPFSHFEPGQYAQGCGESLGGAPADGLVAATRAQEFNQPSSWVLLSKSAGQLRNPLGRSTGAGTHAPSLLNPEGALGFGLASKGSSLSLENTRKRFLGGEGLNVLSRGQTYYHRPGNWAEMPNFFNPYWRPRLASVWQGRSSLPLVDAAAQALPETLNRFPQKLITH
jgi:hypothetical protein